jgi:hypothetical protein
MRIVIPRRSLTWLTQLAALFIVVIACLIDNDKAGSIVRLLIYPFLANAIDEFIKGLFSAPL